MIQKQNVLLNCVYSFVGDNTNKGIKFTVITRRNDEVIHSYEERDCFTTFAMTQFEAVLHRVLALVGVITNIGLIACMCLFISFISPLVSFSQNLFDYEHSKHYADFLYKNKQFKFAIEEYERACFLNPKDTLSKLLLLKSCVNANDFEKGFNISNHFIKNSILSKSLSEEMLRIRILSNRTDSVEYFSEKFNLNSDKKNSLIIASYLIQDERKKSFDFASSVNSQSSELLKLKSIAIEYSTIKNKKPAIAATMSALIPGSGKIYAGNTRDGIISFLMVGGNAFNAWRGFRKHGVNSAYGWIFGTLTVGFYGGNIVGAIKEAKRYNRKIKNEIVNKVHHIINNS